MKRMRAIALLVTITSAPGGEVLVPMAVKSDESSLQLRLVVQTAFATAEDTDTQPLRGELLLAVHCFAPLAAASLRDFRLQATTNYDLRLDFGASGDIVVVGTNVQVFHAEPGPHRPYEPVNNGSVAFLDVPTLLAGLVNYQASPFPCLVLQGAGLPCVGSIDLSDPPMTNVIRQLQGALTLSDGVLRLLGEFTFSEDNVLPALAGQVRLNGRAVIKASGRLLPCLRIGRGDFPDEHRVNWASAFAGFRLYRTSSLTPPVRWEAVEDFFISDDGMTKSAALLNDGANAFYRLSNE
jgi:hypothetical protein